MKPSASKKTEAKARVWGLTGGAASGKTTAARFFSEAGVPVIDADEIARRLRAPGGRAYEPILKRFGTADASRLRERVFSDPPARKELEAILHPLIRDESERRIAELLRERSGAAPVMPVIYEAALLVETGRYRDLHGLIVISADPEESIERLAARDGCSRELARKILDSQLGDAERRAHATLVIENRGTLAELREQVLGVIAHL